MGRLDRNEIGRLLNPSLSNNQPTHPPRPTPSNPTNPPPHQPNQYQKVSFHKYGDYFPGTGSVNDVGYQRGRLYTVNVPLNDGMDDDAYKFVYEPVMAEVRLCGGGTCGERGGGTLTSSIQS